SRVGGYGCKGGPPRPPARSSAPGHEALERAARSERAAAHHRFRRITATGPFEVLEARGFEVFPVMWRRLKAPPDATYPKWQRLALTSRRRADRDVQSVGTQGGVQGVWSGRHQGTRIAVRGWSPRNK